MFKTELYIAQIIDYFPLHMFMFNCILSEKWLFNKIAFVDDVNIECNLVFEDNKIQCNFIVGYINNLVPFKSWTYLNKIFLKIFFLNIKTVQIIKLDGIGPVDNRPSTN